MRKRFPILFGFILLGIALWIMETTWVPARQLFSRLDDMAYDFQLHTQLLAQHSIAKSPVAIVDIDDKSLKEQGRWPWSRVKMAALIDQLQVAGAVVVALDITFPEQETNVTEVIGAAAAKGRTDSAFHTTLRKLAPLFAHDAQFANSIKRMDTVLGVTFIFDSTEQTGILAKPLLVLTPEQQQLNIQQAKGFLSNIPMLQQAASSQGFLNAFPDDDGVLRHATLLVRYGNDVYPSLALEAVRLYTLANSVQLITAPYHNKTRLEAVKLGTHTIPTDAHARMLVPFLGASKTFPYFSATDVLNKRIPAGALQGKLIFVGTSAIGLGDLQTTAVHSAYPGVEVHATVADGILTDHFFFKPAWAHGIEITLLVVLGVVLIVIFPYLGPGLLAGLTVVIPALLIFANNLIWQKAGFVLSVLVPVLFVIVLAMLNMVCGYLFESRHREQLKQIFGQYVPPGHIDNMLKAQGRNYGLQGEEREMTVLFADIRNFTTISEPMKVTELKIMLNDFFTPMTQIIFDNKGTIDKYIGDMIMAFWGAPLKDAEHAYNAINSALAMQEQVEKLKPVFAERNWPEVNIGIGLNSGVMNVGDMGSKFRRNYTILGDAVNLGSRLESLTKFYGVKIMVSEQTRTNQNDFIFRQLDRVQVKGKKTGINIYEVVCRKADSADALQAEIVLHEQALQLYFNQQWDKAQELFKHLNTEHPDSVLYRLYLERIAEFQQNPPEFNWDGVYKHSKK